jgi:hypothetical protein
MTAPHQSPQKTAFAQRPLPQEPHQPHQPVRPPVVPGHQLRPWPVNPEQQGQQQPGYPEQSHRLPGRPEQHYPAPGRQEPTPGRQAVEEELLRARSQAPAGEAERSQPIFVRKKRFEALAWTTVVLGVVGIVGGVVGALVGSQVLALDYLTIGLGVIGVLVGVVALLGTRKVVAAIGTVLCAGAIAVAMTAQVATPDAEATGGGADAAAQDVSLRDCEVVRQDGAVVAQATIEITNRTDQAQSYNINVTVNDRGGPRVGEFNVVATSVAPGETLVLSGAQASGSVSGRAQEGPAECRVANVNRLGLGG